VEGWFLPEIACASRPSLSGGVGPAAAVPDGLVPVGYRVGLLCARVGCGPRAHSACAHMRPTCTVKMGARSPASLVISAAILPARGTSVAGVGARGAYTAFSRNLAVYSHPDSTSCPHLLRAHRNAISDAGPDSAYSASLMAFAALANDKPMRIGRCAGNSDLGASP